MAKTAQKEKTVQSKLWFGVIAGLIVMVVLEPFIPLVGPILGGIVAGWIAKGEGKKAGLLAGFFDAVIFAVLITIFGVAAASSSFGVLSFLGSTLVLTVSLFIIFGFFGLVGGLIADYLNR